MTLADLTRSRPGWWIDRRRDRIRAPLLLGFVLAAVSACSPDYSPDTYATRAVQQANKVEQGVVVGVRNVGVTAEGTIGAASGAAAGGLLGSQTPGNVGGALGTIGGGLMGGLVGTAVEHTTGDTTAYEYIVRKSNGDLLSVTQRDVTPLGPGAKSACHYRQSGPRGAGLYGRDRAGRPRRREGEGGGNREAGGSAGQSAPRVDPDAPAWRRGGRQASDLARAACARAGLRGGAGCGYIRAEVPAESQPHPPAQSP